MPTCGWRSVQGVPIASNLGQVDQADKNLRAGRGIHSLGAGIAAGKSQGAAAFGGDRARSNDPGRYQRPIRRSRSSSRGNRPRAWKSSTPRRATSQRRRRFWSPISTWRRSMSTTQRADDALALCRRGSELARIFGRTSNRGTFLQVAANISQSRGRSRRGSAVDSRIGGRCSIQVAETPISRKR